jgi:hypothetical protein
MEGTNEIKKVGFGDGKFDWITEGHIEEGWEVEVGEFVGWIDGDVVGTL